VPCRRRQWLPSIIAFAASLTAALVLAAASATHADQIDDIQASKIAQEQLENCVRSQRTAAWSVYKGPAPDKGTPLYEHLTKDLAAVLARCERPGQREIICKPYIPMLVSGTPKEFYDNMMLSTASHIIQWE
jgi:hypothetical protein